MPELHSIQTFERLKGTEFRPALDKFESVLRRIGLWNKEVQNEFATFDWKIEDDGLVYSSITQCGYFNNSISDVKIGPLVLAYTPSLGSSFKDNWISCQLLMQAGDLRGSEYFEQSYFLVETLCREMFKEFRQTGIYFADEAQDGSDFDGLRTGDMSKLWKFDFAVIPLTLQHLYKDTPATHHVIEREDSLELFDKKRWTTKSATDRAT